ncbi:MAG: 50S ribosomal protein L25/general stress protein Ctc [Desulfobacteraceae bacterium]|nr:50S ribosomal protein L25/general stress protein Ctc [Desulfobacteraceae bacterium]
MELIELKTNIRTSVGNSQARALRRKKQIPAVLYGRGKKNVLLSVYLNELEQAIKKSKTGQALLNLVVQNHETYTKPVIIKELQTHPVKQNILHVDFYEIDMNRKIKVKVPVVTKGKSKGVELGGILQIIRRELEVLCLPLEIPKSFEIDISDLDIGDSVHVKSIPLKDNIEIPADVDFTVLTIVSPKAVEEAVPEEAEEEIEAEEAAAEEEASKAEG